MTGTLWGLLGAISGPGLRHHRSVCEGREGSGGDSPPGPHRGPTGGTFSPGCKRSGPRRGEPARAEARPPRAPALLKGCSKTEAPLPVAPARADERAQPHGPSADLQTLWRAPLPRSPAALGRHVRKFSETALKHLPGFTSGATQNKPLPLDIGTGEQVSPRPSPLRTWPGPRSPSLSAAWRSSSLAVGAV